MYLLDVFFKNFNKDSIHILLLTLCSVNDWFFRIQLIVKTFDVITKPTGFMFLIGIGKTLSTFWFIAACWFDHSFKVCIYHEGNSHFPVMASGSSISSKILSIPYDWKLALPATCSSF